MVVGASLLPGVMPSSGDAAVTAQPDGIYVPITTSLLFCINLRHKHTLTPAVPFLSWFRTVESIGLLKVQLFSCEKTRVVEVKKSLICFLFCLRGDR